MKGMLVYQSRYGATKQYAGWAAEALGWPAVALGQLTEGQLSEAEALVYAGGLYAGSVSGLKKFFKRLPASGARPLAVLAVGLANPADAGYIQKLREGNLPAERRDAPLFLAQGALDYARMGFLFRAMMSMMVKSLKAKPEAERTFEDRAMIEHFGGRLDLTDRAQLAPLLDWARRLG